MLRKALKAMLIIAGVILLGNTSSLAMREEYLQGQKLGEKGIALGSPASVDDGFFSRAGNTSSLTSLNDTTLVGKGGEALSEKVGPGDLLYASQKSAINAREEHQINQEDGFIKTSMGIEADPLKQTGGKYLSRSEIKEKDVTYTCQEGVLFDVDIMRQLVYEPNIKTKMVEELIWHEGEVGSHASEVFWGHFPIEYYRGNYAHNFKNPALKSQLAVSISKHFGQPLEKLGKIDLIRATLASERPYNNPYTKTPSFEIFTFRYQLKEQKQVKHDAGGKEYWQVINPKEESLMEGNACHETKRLCLDKDIKDFGQGITVTRPCWKERITYRCQSLPKEGCKSLSAKGCILKESKCLITQGSLCLKWARTYICKEKEESVSAFISDSPLFCLDGGCYTPELKKNSGLNEAVAYLALFQEMQKQMEGNPPKVFKGDIKGCSTHLLNFTNCCTSMDGWGVGVGLSSCSAEEKALAGQRDKNQCHYVGHIARIRFWGFVRERRAPIAVLDQRSQGYFMSKDALS